MSIPRHLNPGKADLFDRTSFLVQAIVTAYRDLVVPMNQLRDAHSTRQPAAMGACAVALAGRAREIATMADDIARHAVEQVKHNQGSKS